MNATSALLVAFGGAVGAPVRFLTDAWVQARHRTAFPWGTFTVNVIGSFLLGLVAGGVAVGAWATGWQTWLGTGLCGALTTFSTFSVEVVRLGEAGRKELAGLYVVASVVAGLAACAAGWGISWALG